MSERTSTETKSIPLNRQEVRVTLSEDGQRWVFRALPESRELLDMVTREFARPTKKASA